VTFKSLEELKKMKPRVGIVEIESADVKFLLQEKGLNSLLFKEPFSKICFNCSAVSAFLNDGNVVYVDLDTMFTSYVRNGIFSYSSDNELQIYLPRAHEFEEILADMCSSINAETELVVIDSLNSFYHLYDGIKIGSLNHLLTSYILFLLNHCRSVGSTLLVTSMIRHKKTSEWVLAPSSRRLIELKSDVILTPELINGNLSIDLIKHGELKETKFLLRKERMPILA